MQPLSCYSVLEADDIYYQNAIQLPYFTLLYIKLPVITFLCQMMHVYLLKCPIILRMQTQPILNVLA